MGGGAKQGTDELLLTLPATDVQIVLGKYAAVLGIYSVSLLISLSHVLVLMWLGNPDPGLLAGNYLGYWLLGAALIPIGMLASVLTSNATVAFVLAALLCSAPVLIDAAAGLFDPLSGRFLAQAGVFVHFNEFAQGIVSAGALTYFAGLAALFAGLNVAVIRRGRIPLSPHVAVRAAAFLVALAAATCWCAGGRPPRRDGRTDSFARRRNAPADDDAAGRSRGADSGVRQP